MDGPPAQPRWSPLRSLPTPPGPRCGAAVPLGVQSCPRCARPPAIHDSGCLPAPQINRGVIHIAGALFRWTTAPVDRAARATATAQIRTVLPDTPAGNEPRAVTLSIRAARPDAGTPQAPATR